MRCSSECCKVEVVLVLCLHTYQCGQCGRRVSSEGVPVNKPHVCDEEGEEELSVSSVETDGLV
jgi:hypothetical protein